MYEMIGYVRKSHDGCCQFGDRTIVITRQKKRKRPYSLPDFFANLHCWFLLLFTFWYMLLYMRVLISFQISFWKPSKIGLWNWPAHSIERAWGLIDRQVESRLHAVLPVKVVRFVRDVVPRHFHRLDDSPRLGQEVEVEVGVWCCRKCRRGRCWWRRPLGSARCRTARRSRCGSPGCWPRCCRWLQGRVRFWLKSHHLIIITIPK